MDKVLPAFREIADLVHAVRGLVSVAHIKERGTRSFLERLKREGLDAVETRHPSHDRELRARLTDIALRLGLLRTGGSDWHGDPEPGETHGALGSQEVPLEWLERLDASRAGPPARRRPMSRLLAAGQPRARTSPLAASDGRTLRAARAAAPRAGCCWPSIPATTPPAEIANCPPCAMSCQLYQREHIRPFGVNPASAESHAGYAARLGLPFPLLSDPGPGDGARVRRGPARRLAIARSVVLIERDGDVLYSQAGAPGADDRSRSR